MILRSTDIRAALRDRRSRLAPRRLQRGFFTLPGGMGAAGKGPSGDGQTMSGCVDRKRTSGRCSSKQESASLR